MQIRQREGLPVFFVNVNNVLEDYSRCFSYVLSFNRLINYLQHFFVKHRMSISFVQIMISSELFSKRMYVKKGIIVQKQTTLEVEKPLKFSALISFFFPSLQSTNSISPVN